MRRGSPEHAATLRRSEGGSGAGSLSFLAMRPCPSFTKIASSFLQLGSEEEDAVGVTEEVVAFVRDIAMHPQTWLNFPFVNDDYEDDGMQCSFEM
ncbi:BSD domain-containing protein [Actinidia rufa]|uniref:BSD domain-containing protein n=1 Tax=Actinidia rufa TaxID=165716 RepID=A0A7J0EK33_9ERIC|nr:BSD domain-containing protein [Actinidia rufa]